MKYEEYDLPDELLYTKEHEWCRAEGDTVKVGITDFAAKTLNDVVYVTVPKPGDHVKQFAAMGTVESIKAVSELYSPISGSVVEVNRQLEMSPELVNESPYRDGWLLEVKPDDYVAEVRNLLDAKAYAAHLELELRKRQHD
jgi:glycine cleavage system H protein